MAPLDNWKGMQLSLHIVYKQIQFQINRSPSPVQFQVKRLLCKLLSPYETLQKVGPHSLFGMKLTQTSAEISLIKSKAELLHFRKICFFFYLNKVLYVISKNKSWHVQDAISKM